jgi:bifunctional DNA-binding transcriptional regulator/antitoxin component of YhaV-PrlF toxin-antitoxin module
MGSQLVRRISKSTDERGRLSLPKDLRDRFGDRYRIVEFSSHIGLFPVDDDPPEGTRRAVGQALEATDRSESPRDAFVRETGARADRRASETRE